MVKGQNGEALINFNGKDVRPEEIASHVLMKIKEDAEKFLGDTVTEAVVIEAPKDPNVILKESRVKYLEAYRVLQEALRGQNQQEVQQANGTFQAASKAYKEAQSMVASQ